MRRLLAAAAAALAFSCAPPATQRRWPVMGTIAALELRARDGARAERAVRAAFDDVNRAMSNWSPESDLSRANAAAYPGPAPIADPDLRACLAAAFDAAARTDGAFDPTVGPLMRAYGFRPSAARVPSEREREEAAARVGWKRVELGPGGASLRFAVPGMEVDLGGIAKGCALDVAARRLEAAGGARGALLDLGGNLLAIGSPPEGGLWRIAIKDPEDPQRAGALLAFEGGAVSTSANYENRFEAGGATIGHLMDARTGGPSASDVVSATVLAATATRSDALSTALVVAGSAGAASILERFPGARAVLFLDGRDGRRVLASASLAGHLVLAPRPASSAPITPSFSLP
jgi:thiamine biosynthesis lipoprotein